MNGRCDRQVMSQQLPDRRGSSVLPAEVSACPSAAVRQYRDARPAGLQHSV